MKNTEMFGDVENLLQKLKYFKFFVQQHKFQS